eukprot:5606431-Prymnesium_polylepis.1
MQGSEKFTQRIHACFHHLHPRHASVCSHPPRYGIYTPLACTLRHCSAARAAMHMRSSGRSAG